MISILFFVGILAFLAGALRLVLLVNKMSPPKRRSFVGDGGMVGADGAPAFGIDHSVSASCHAGDSDGGCSSGGDGGGDGGGD